MIELKQVTKRYKQGFTALNQVNFCLEKGEMAFLTGHSGAGKSTLIKLIAGLEKPSAGEIIVNGAQLKNLKSRHLAAYRDQLGIIFQTPYLLKDRTIFDNVALPLRIRGLSSN